MNEFFGPGNWRLHAFPNQQILDWEGLLGRVRSSSYAPLPGTSEFQALEEELRDLFAANAEDGRITFFYDTKVYCGRLS
jgi:hypothetical protein